VAPFIYATGRDIFDNGLSDGALVAPDSWITRSSPRNCDPRRGFARQLTPWRGSPRLATIKLALRIPVIIRA
jgi:hypothetical protein